MTYAALCVGVCIKGCGQPSSSIKKADPVDGHLLMPSRLSHHQLNGIPNILLNVFHEPSKKPLNYGPLLMGSRGSNISERPSHFLSGVTLGICVHQAMFLFSSTAVVSLHVWTACVPSGTSPKEPYSPGGEVSIWRVAAKLRSRSA